MILRLCLFALMATNINAVELQKTKTPVVTKTPLPFTYKVDGKKVLIEGNLNKKMFFDAPSNPFKPNDTEKDKLTLISKADWQIQKDIKKQSFKMIDSTGTVRSLFGLLSWTTRQFSDHTVPREPQTKGVVISAFFYDEKAKELIPNVFFAMYLGTPKDKDKFIPCTQIKDLELKTVKDSIDSGKCFWYNNSDKDKRYEITIQNP